MLPPTSKHMYRQPSISTFSFRQILIFFHGQNVDLNYYFTKNIYQCSYSLFHAQYTAQIVTNSSFYFPSEVGGQVWFSNEESTESRQRDLPKTIQEGRAQNNMQGLQALIPMLISGEVWEDSIHFNRSWKLKQWVRRLRISGEYLWWCIYPHKEQKNLLSAFFSIS